MPRYLLLVYAILIIVGWSLALFGPVDRRDVFVGYAQGTTLGALVLTALTELAVWLHRRRR